MMRRVETRWSPCYYRVQHRGGPDHLAIPARPLFRLAWDILYQHVIVDRIYSFGGDPFFPGVLRCVRFRFPFFLMGYCLLTDKLVPF